MNKETLREKLKKIRRELPLQRRKRAAEQLSTAFSSYSVSILSFVSFSHEIDTSLLNRFLASAGKLLLPKIEGNTLKIYHVACLDQQLEKGSFGLYEPIPSKCEEAHSDQIDIALVPGLGFDLANHRLGYGKGCYDRFLASSSCVSIGIGFSEQLVDALPVDPTDFPLTQISLY